MVQHQLSTTPVQQQAVHGLSMKRRGTRELVEHRLGAQEMRRRLWHMVPGLMPVVLWVIPHADPISLMLKLTIVGIATLFAAVIIARFHSIARGPDDSVYGCVLGYAGSVAGALLLFPSAPEIGLALFAILAFGDGSATLAGQLLRGPALPWNPEKTWSGFLAFLVFSLPASALYYWQETRNPLALGPEITFLTAVACCGPAVFFGAVVESLRARLDDNIRVGVLSMLMLVLMHHLLVGWH